MTNFQVKLSLDPKDDPDGPRGYAVVPIMAADEAAAIAVAEALFPMADSYEVLS